MKRPSVTVVFPLLTAALLAVAGCATTPTVRYGDAGAQTPLSTDFGSSDLQQVAGAMADSLLAFPSVAEVTARRRPVITVDRVKNKTMQHIDTEAITDSIRTRLIRSGKFRFIDRTTDAATVDEIRTQQEGGLVDRKKAVEFGGQEGAEYLLTANLAEIRQANDDVTDVYYKFTMSLKNLRTGILEWSDEKEIRKISTRPYVGS